MQLLKTKFHIPVFDPGALVSRQRIVDLFNRPYPVVVLSAPAGFGKTTVLSEWASGSGVNPFWISFEKSEDNPAVFWHYFLSAISDMTGSSRTLERFKSSGPSGIEAVLISLINELTELTSKTTLILDDYHLITTPEIHKGVEFFIDHIPSDFRIIISGRERPKIPLARLRSANRLMEIDADTLRFNAAEADTFLNALNSLNLDPEVVRALTGKTEGWATGLRLALLSITGQETGTESFISDFTGSHRYILDYLIEEVLFHIDPAMKSLLLETAVTERLCADLCSHITGNDQSGALISEIDRKNLFLVPLDNHRIWFRFHHLFRECLLKQLESESPERVRNCHEKAFEWFRDKGLINEAFHHAVVAEKTEEAAHLLEENAPALFSESGGAILKNAIMRLPEPVTLKTPKLCCYLALLDAMAGDFGSLPLLEKPEFEKETIVTGFRLLINGYRYFYLTGEFARSIATINKALELLPDSEEAPRELGALILGLACRYNGDFQAAKKMTMETSRTLEPGAMMAINQADILMAEGRLNESLHLINDTMERGKQKFGKTLTAEYGYLLIQKASILREKNNLEDALKSCRKGLGYARENEYIELIFLGYLEYARCLAVDKNYPEATKAINRSMKAARASTIWGEAMTSAIHAKIELQKGKTATALKILDTSGGFDEKEIPYYRSLHYLTAVRACIALGNTDRAHEITDYMIREDLREKRFGRLLECYVLKAIAYHAEGNIEAAADTIRNAFRISEPEGHIRIYIDEGEPIADLFAECKRRGTLPAYLTPFLKKETRDQTEKSREKTVIINEFKESFNNRETEILGLMKEGCSNKEIGDRLFISVNTVRWYASRIYTKLDARRRGEAVSAAEKFGLI